MRLPLSIVAIVAVLVGSWAWQMAASAVGQPAIHPIEQPPDDPAAESRQAIERLQTQLDQLQARMDAAPAAAVATDSADSEQGWIDGFSNQVNGQFSGGKKSWRITLAGWLEGQALASSDQVTGRSTVVYVDQQSTLGAKPQFNIHGQASALKFNFESPDVWGFRSGGRIYMNFMGDQPLLNKATPFLINAYWELTNDQWRILCGQYYALVNPLDPTMINFALGMYTGNISSYRGQLRVERYFHLAENVVLAGQAAITQPFVSDFAPPGQDPEESGSDNGLPDINGRAVLAVGPVVEGLENRTFELGVSGMAGQARHIAHQTKYTPETAMIGCDAQLARSRVGVKGEFFYGYGLSSYGGGIGQGFHPSNYRPIRAAGGWAEIWTKPFKSLKVALGYGIDHPTEIDLFPSNLRTKNRNECYYLTTLWNITQHFDVGVEIDYRKTGYIAGFGELPGMTLVEPHDAMVYWFRSRMTF